MSIMVYHACGTVCADLESGTIYTRNGEYVVSLRKKDKRIFNAGYCYEEQIAIMQMIDLVEQSQSVSMAAQKIIENATKEQAIREYRKIIIELLIFLSISSFGIVAIFSLKLFGL